jgi:hypothetical protein
LTPATRDRVNALLKLNAKYKNWSATVDKEAPGALADDKNLMIFMIAATWADGIKRDSTYTQDGSQNGNRPAGSPDPGKNTGYDDLLMHKYWHFIDTPFTSDGTALPAIPTPNAQERIALFRTVLASTSADPLKSYDLGGRRSSADARAQHRSERRFRRQSSQTQLHKVANCMRFGTICSVPTTT